MIKKQFFQEMIIIFTNELKEEGKAYLTSSHFYHFIVNSKSHYIYYYYWTGGKLLWMT